jgi:hypothetical protein
MTGSGHRGGADGAPDRVRRTLAGDFDALQAVTSRDLPPLASLHSSTFGARGEAPSAHPGGVLMNMFRSTKARPWLTTALGTAAVALVLLFVPISYNRLIGSELTLRLGSTELGGETIRGIASDLRTTLGAEEIRVEMDAATGLTMIADIPNASWRQVSRLAIDYARGLAGRGIQVSPRVRPRFEKAQGNVYAAIGNLVEVRVQTAGKNDQEIAEEIRSQLLVAGVSDAAVEVNRQDGRTQIRVEMQKTDGGSCESAADCPDFKIMLDGQEPGDPSQQKCKIKVCRTEGMTDQQVIDDVKNQLAAQGVTDAEVYFENGKLQVKRAGQ